MGAACKLSSHRGRILPAALVFFVMGLELPSLGGEETLSPATDPAITAARALWLAGRYEEAEAACRKTPLDTNPNAVIVLARTLQERGRTREAVELLSEAVKRRPAALLVQGELALLAFESGDYETAKSAAASGAQGERPSAAALWIQAELHRVHGRLSEAESGYDRLAKMAKQYSSPVDVEELLWAIRGLVQHARWTRRPSTFRVAVQQLIPRLHRHEPSYWPAYLFAAELFAEKFNRPQAEIEIDRALAINPASPAVHALAGSIALRQYDEASVLAAVERIERTAPNSPMACRLLGQLHLRRWRYQSSVESLQKALKSNSHDEATMGMLAAVAWAAEGLHREAPEATRKLMAEAVARNSHCGVFYWSLAREIDAMRKFPFAAPWYEEAVQRLPQQIGPRADLGLLWMRLGEEAKAARVLTESFEIDPHHVRVKNMLEVLDVLQGYATLETEHFILRFNRGSDGIWAEEAARHLEQTVYPEITRQLGYEPVGKTLFEVFSKERNTSGHGWFSARMSGLPFIGTVGACAGRIVAMTSPNDVREKFNWARMLRHEFVHVVNLQQTNYNVPHWFTEAIAVRMENASRPPQWDEVLARRKAAGSLFTLETIDHGFTRPGNTDNWTLAYCQASLYAEYLAANYGEDVLNKMLNAFAENLSLAEAVQEVLGVTMDDLERGYDAFIESIVAGVHLERIVEPPIADLQRAVRENPEDADAHAALASSLLNNNRKPESRNAALRALDLKADHPLALYVLARLELTIGDKESAIEKLEQAYDPEAPDLDVLELLAANRLAEGRYQEAESMYRLGAKRFPHPDRWLKSLARVYLKLKDEDSLYGVLAELAEMQGDNMLYRRKLLQIASKKGSHAEVVKWANQMLHIDVMDAEHHAQKGAALLALGKASDATRALRTASQLNPRRYEWRLTLAKAESAAGQKDAARKTLDELRRQAPDLSGLENALQELDR